MLLNTATIDQGWARDPEIQKKKQGPLVSQIRSIRLELFRKKDVLRNFVKFSGKHLRQSVFFNRAAGLRPAKSDQATVKRYKWDNLKCNF